MKRILNKLGHFFVKLKASFADYKVTMTGIVLYTLYGTVMAAVPYTYEMSWFVFTYESEISSVFLIFCLSSLFIETCFREGSCETPALQSASYRSGKCRIVKICSYAAAVVISCGFTFFSALRETEQLGGISGAWLSETAVRLLPGYLLLLVIGTIYCSFRKTGVGFEEYTLKVFVNFFKTGIVYFILFIGMTMVCGIFNMLILNEGSFYLDSACGVLLTGLYLAPKCIISMQDMKSDPGPFSRSIVKYVLSVLTVCAAAIVYLYVLKIVLLWEIPSNEIFSILSALFCFGMPVWVMAECYRDGTKYSRLVSVLPYMFAPLICLQMYSMGVRIIQYGMTPDRYMGMMLIIFEAGCLLIWHFRKGRREIMLLLLSILVVISVFIPGINMYKLSEFWQFSILKKYYQAAESGEELSVLDSARLTGAWEYLDQQEKTRDIIEEYDIFDEKIVEKLNEEDVEEMNQSVYDTHYIHCCQMVGDLDVSDYGKMSMLNQDSQYDEIWRDETEVDFTEFQFVIRETGEKLPADIQDFAKRCMDYEKEHPDAIQEEMTEEMKAYNRICLDEGKELFINHFKVTYEEGIKNGKDYFSWQDMEIGGILLEK